MIIYVNNHNNKAFTKIEISPKDNIKNGKLRIFNIGLIVIFINQRIIHQTKKVFQASIEFGEQLLRHPKVTQLSIASSEFSHSNITIIYNINAFNIIDKRIFIEIMGYKFNSFFVSFICNYLYRLEFKFMYYFF